MISELTAGTPVNEPVRIRAIARTRTRTRATTTVAVPVPQPETVATVVNFLVLDNRFGNVVYVILESDPRTEREFPELGVREIVLECRATPGATPQDPGVGAALPSGGIPLT